MRGTLSKYYDYQVRSVDATDREAVKHRFTSP